MGELQKRIKTELLQELNLWYSLDKDIDWHINELMAPIINVIEEMRKEFPKTAEGENRDEADIWFEKWFGEPRLTQEKISKNK